MEELTPRQIEILKAIIKEYTATGEPVGSEVLEKKYRLGVSPATIRNEMAELVKKGYLDKSYFSSGREPTALAFRYYIQNVMKPKELSTVDEVTLKNSVWDERDDVQRLLSHMTRVLAMKTGLMSFAHTTKNDLYYYGVSNLFNMHEFLDMKISHAVLLKMEETGFLKRLMEAMLKKPGEDVAYFIGEEDFDDPSFAYCAGVVGEFEGEKTRGIIGVFGPKRMYFDIVIPHVRYAGHLITSLLKG